MFPCVVAAGPPDQPVLLISVGRFSRVLCATNTKSLSSIFSSAERQEAPMGNGVAISPALLYRLNHRISQGVA